MCDNYMKQKFELIHNWERPSLRITMQKTQLDKGDLVPELFTGDQDT